MSSAEFEPVDLDEARDNLNDNGIDGADRPYNPEALRAMRTADRLLAEVEHLRKQIADVLVGQALADHLGDIRDEERHLWRLLGVDRPVRDHDSAWRPPGERCGRDDWSIRPPSPSSVHRPYHFARVARLIPASVATCAIGRPASTRSQRRRLPSGVNGALACLPIPYPSPSLHVSTW